MSPRSGIDQISPLTINRRDSKARRVVPDRDVLCAHGNVDAARIAGRTPSLRAIIHADDCGLTAGITDGIIACHDRGAVQRVSVIVNGPGWDHAVAALQQRPHLGVVLHINLFEGVPLSSPSEIDLLVGRDGRFHRSFGALWVAGYGPTAERLRAQIRLELARQFDRFVTAFGDRGFVSVDGHVHFHMLPPVFDVLMALCQDYGIRAMRLPRERFPWPPTTAALPSIPNVAKAVVLQSLSRRALHRLDARGVHTTDAFVGVLETGRMTLDGVRAALNRLRAAAVTGEVEVLFHPGRARADEAAVWVDRPGLRMYYRSEEREREGDLLRSAAFAEMIREFTPGMSAGEDSR